MRNDARGGSPARGTDRARLPPVAKALTGFLEHPGAPPPALPGGTAPALEALARREKLRIMNQLRD